MGGITARSTTFLAPLATMSAEVMKGAFFAGHRIYRNPENWQPFSLVCLAIISEYHHTRNPEGAPPKIIKALDAAQLLDFFAFLKIPAAISSIDPKRIRFSELSLEILGDLFLTLADVGCIPVFLQEWSIIDLGGIASGIGKNRYLTFVLGGSADRRVKGALCTGFLFRFLSGLKTKIICDNEAERRRATFIMLRGGAEFAFNLAILLRISEPNINRLMFFAKLACLIEEFTGPDESGRL